MAERITVKAAAKVNLCLDVTGVLPNGYHSIESVFQTVGLYDEVTVETDDSGEITVSCELPESFAKSDPIPCDERNIAYKAAKRFFEAKRTISCGTWVNLYVNLKKWKYRKKITRVDIVVSSEGNGWSDDASVSVRRLGTKK